MIGKINHMKLAMIRDAWLWGALYFARELYHGNPNACLDSTDLALMAEDDLFEITAHPECAPDHDSRKSFEDGV